tara:strand:+ start:267 stop:665 length:399 start_codon:yes stop_codon:yes gene_type:complete
MSWAQLYTDAAIAQANPSAIVSTSNIGAWIANNQPPEEASGLRAQRIEWLSNALRDVMKAGAKFDTAFPSQSIRAAELGGRLLTAVEDVYPGPTRAELEAKRIESERELGMEEAEYGRRKAERDERNKGDGR